jgi:hypothetical protein
MPSLTVREHGGRCRLRLADAWGDGATLQEAADDLVARVVRHAGALRAGGWACGSELSWGDERWLDFLYEVGEIAARGGEVRSRVVGGWPASGEAA